MTVKTAMILAAGRGERMRPLTDSVPKPLLKVKGKALIEYHLENLRKSGYQRVVINHAWLGQQIELSLGNGARFGLDIVYSAEKKALETAGGIVKALPLLCPNHQTQSFTVINGDVYTDFDLEQLPSHLPTGANSHLILVDNPEHNPEGDFYLSGQKLDTSQGQKLTFSGIAVYNRSFFSNISQGVLPLAPMLRTAIAQDKVSGQHHQGKWTDVGTPARLEELNQE